MEDDFWQDEWRPTKSVMTEIQLCFGRLWYHSYANFLFQLYLAPAHSGRLTTKWFADHIITVFGQPPHLA